MSKKTATFRFMLPVEPVPASRPRVTRRGHVYYGKRYSHFRKESDEFISSTDFGEGLPLCGMLKIDVVFYCPKPKTTKRQSPRGDIDNYMKTLDVFNGVIWIDDDQIVEARGRKVFSDNPRIELEVNEIGRVCTT